MRSIGRPLSTLLDFAAAAASPGTWRPQRPRDFGCTEAVVRGPSPAASLCRALDPRNEGHITI